MRADDVLWLEAEVGDPTQVGAARRLAARIGEATDLSDTVAGQLGLVVVELATNLLKHAVRGQLFLRGEGRGERAVVDVVAIDHGPGMDLERCFDDGFSTGGTSGTGLGAVRRAAALFDAWSDPQGSVLFARLGTQAGPRRGSIARALKGESESGDLVRFVTRASGWSAAVVDGLGHGPGAAVAAQAIGVAHAEQPDDPARCLALAHERARATRGAAASVVHFDADTGVLVHAGVGNVAAVVLGREDHRGLASQNGTLGGACPTVRGQRMELVPRSLVVMHTDGLSARWSLPAYPGLRARHPQVIAGVLFRDMQRARDDASVLVIEA